MKKLPKKIKLLSILILIVFTVSSLLTILPYTLAQTATMESYPFIGATPNPVQVNQPVLFHVGISQQLFSWYMGWEDLSIIIQKPDGHTDTLTDIRTDSTGGTGVVYTPTMIGTYTAYLEFPDQEITPDKMTFGLPVGGIMLASTSEEIEVIVQEEPIQYYPGHSLPNEYWTRPINAQLYEWGVISGDWLKPAGSYTMPPIPKYHTGNMESPETSHILWTKPYTQGGLANFDLGNVQYEMGDAYELKFIGSVILSGVLYYNRFENRGNNPELDQDVVAVDIKTGEELWVKNWNNERLDFAQAFYWDSYNYHGVFGYLWTESGSTWKAYDPLSGRWEYTMENVPSGWNLYGPKGEIYRYTVNRNAGWMTLWNSSRVVSDRGSWRPQGRTFNATEGIEWNVTIPTDLPGGTSMYFLHDRIHGSTASGLFGTTSPDVTSWAINVAPGHEGELIFNKTVSLPESGLTLVWADASCEDNVFIISAKENLKYYGFSLETGDLLWTTEPEPYLSVYDKWYGNCYGYGKFFTGRTSGVVICYDLATGNRLWTYDVADIYAEVTWSNNYPIEFHFVADGKVVVSYGEHSPINPLPRGAPLVVLDVETGEKIWELNWANNWWGGVVMVGDSTMVGLNAFDNRLYSVGKGPTKITIDAPSLASDWGDKIILRGTVTDISPGTQTSAIKMRFPNGVPAVSDGDMSAWMEYVYYQFAMPMVSGVPVKLEVVVDPNGNWYDIGTAYTDATGFYSIDWEPPVPGPYLILATFEGSKSYYPTYIETSVVVNED